MILPEKEELSVFPFQRPILIQRQSFENIVVTNRFFKPEHDEVKEVVFSSRKEDHCHQRRRHCRRRCCRCRCRRRGCCCRCPCCRRCRCQFC